MLGPILDALLGFLFVPKRRTSIGYYRRADDAEIAAALARYQAWATKHHLEPTEAGRTVFAGLVAGREIVFNTGLAGSSPLAPELLVTIEVPVEAPRLVRRGTEDPIAGPILASRKEVSSVALTKTSVRVTFDKLAEPEVLEVTIEALDEAVRNLRSVDLPYRG